MLNTRLKFVGVLYIEAGITPQIFCTSSDFFHFSFDCYLFCFIHGVLKGLHMFASGFHSFVVYQNFDCPSHLSDHHCLLWKLSDHHCF